MKCQCLFSEKTAINLLTADLAQSVIKVNLQSSDLIFVFASLTLP